MPFTGKPSSAGSIESMPLASPGSAIRKVPPFLTFTPVEGWAETASRRHAATAALALLMRIVDRSSSGHIAPVPSCRAAALVEMPAGQGFRATCE